MTAEEDSPNHGMNAGLGLQFVGSGHLSGLTDCAPYSHVSVSGPPDSNDENWCPSSAVEDSLRPDDKSFAKSVPQCQDEVLSNSVANDTLLPASRVVLSDLQNIRQCSTAAVEEPKQERDHHLRDGSHDKPSSLESRAAVLNVDRASLPTSRPMASPATNRCSAGRTRVFKSYPTSPTMHQRMMPSNHPSTGLISRPFSSKPVLTHRSSHSLGQIGTSGALMTDLRMIDYSHASVPGSPADRVHQHALAAFLQFPGQRQSIGHIAGDQSSFFASLLSHDSSTKSSPVRPTSPSNSLTSSFSSISPMGSTRLNPDGSFTSQDVSLDDVSTSASEPLSRASSSFDELHFNEADSLASPSTARTTKQKVRLRNIDRKLICDYSYAHPDAKQDVIASQFGIERSTVSKILKQKDKWLAIDPDSDLARIAKHRAVKFPAIEQRLTEWIARLQLEGTVIKDAMIRKEALSIAEDLGVAEDKFKASGGWIEKFRERHSLPKTGLRDHPPVDSPDANYTQPDCLMLDTLASWNGSEIGRVEAAHAVSHSITAGVHAVTSQRTAKSETMTVSSIICPSAFENDIARPRMIDSSEQTCIYQPVPSHATLSNSLEGSPGDVQAVTNNVLYFGQGADTQRDKNAAACYAMNATKLDSSPVKRRRTEPDCFMPSHTQMDTTLERCFVTNPSASTAFGDAANFHGQTSINLAASPSISNEYRRGRRASVQASSREHHQPKTSSPLRLSAPNSQSISASSTIDETAREDTVPAALRERIDQLKHEASLSVTPGQAHQSLDLVMKFLNEQPRPFLPSDHFAIIGNLQANLEQLIRGHAPLDNQTKSTNICSGSDVRESE